MQIVWIIIIVIVLYFVYIYNRLITLRNRGKESLSDIDVQLKRRYDLIPNLVKIVQAYAKHEKSIFENVAKLRSQAMNGDKSLNDQAKIEDELSKNIKSLFAVAENYPDLKANENFLELQKELVDTENKIQASRRFYNTNVLALNTSVEVFPKNIIASIFNFKKMEFFEVEDTKERENIEIKIDK